MQIKLEQEWETLDKAIAYFLDLLMDLQAYKKHPHPPSELFLHVKAENPEIQDVLTGYGCEITMENLSDEK